MKVLLIHNFYRFMGGEDLHVRMLESGLEARGYEVVTYYAHSAAYEPKGFFEKIKFALSFLFSVSTAHSIKRLIKREEPDIAHVHNVSPIISSSVYFVLKSEKIPIVQTVHNYRLMCLNGLFLLPSGRICERCGKGNFFNGALRKCYRESWVQSLLMAVSLFIIRNLFNIWQNVQVFICPTGFVAEKLAEAGCPKDKLLIASAISKETVGACAPDQTPYAVYVGRLSEEKGVWLLLNAFSHLPNINLKIVGSGPLLESITMWIREKKLLNIDLLGHRNESECMSIIGKAHCTIFPSQCYETLGLTILESLAASVPVIASRLGERQRLIVDGVNGALYKHDSCEELIEILRRFFENPNLLTDMRKGARQTYEDVVSKTSFWEQISKAYSGAIAKLVGFE